MRRLSVFTALGMLAVAATTYAAPGKAREAWASGQLERFDATTKSVVVKQGTHEMTFTLAPDARLMQGKKALQPTDLTGDVGRHVKIRYTTNGANKVADRINVVETTTAHASNTPKKR
jgi:hypothetical protein